MIHQGAVQAGIQPEPSAAAGFLRTLPQRMVALAPSRFLLLAAAGAAVSGLLPVFVRLSDVGATASGGWRFVWAAPFLWLWMKLESRPETTAAVKPRHVRGLVTAGLLFALTLYLLHHAFYKTSAVNAVLLGNFSALFVPLLTWVTLSRRPSVQYVSAMAMALVGAICVGSPAGSSFAFSTSLGDGLALASAATWACYVMVLKQLRRELNAPTILFWSSLVAGPVLLLGAALHGEVLVPGSLLTMLPLLGLGVGVHVCGHGLVAYSMARLSANIVVIILFIAPAVSAVLGWVLFDEALSRWQLCGGGAILLAMAAARDDEGDASPSALRPLWALVQRYTSRGRRCALPS